MNKINHPEHYNHGIECIKYIDSHGFNFALGNVIKYVTRAGHKGDAIEDLSKAKWYLDHEIQRLMLEREGNKCSMQDG